MKNDNKTRKVNRKKKEPQSKCNHHFDCVLNAYTKCASIREKEIVNHDDVKEWMCVYRQVYGHLPNNNLHIIIYWFYNVERESIEERFRDSDFRISNKWWNPNPRILLLLFLFWWCDGDFKIFLRYFEISSDDYYLLNIFCLCIYLRTLQSNVCNWFFIHWANNVWKILFRLFVTSSSANEVFILHIIYA